MLHIAVIAATPLQAGGLLAALSPEAGAEGLHGPGRQQGQDWQPQVQPAHQPLPVHTAALVLQGTVPDNPPAWPALLPLVLLSDDPREGAALSARGDVPGHSPANARTNTNPHANTRPLALLPANATPAQLRAALAAVLQGLCVRDASLPQTYPWWGADAGDHEALTPRELEVYELVGKGLSNRDIGGVLGISAHTAKFHVGQILAKVGAATRAEAVSAGLRMGLIGL